MTHSVEKMCQVLEVSSSGYYDWTKRKPSRQASANDVLLTYIRAIHQKSRGLYGSPRITRKLWNMGFVCSENRVARLMRENDIASRRVRKFKATTDSKHDLPVAENLLNQNFATTGLNRVWVSDITYIHTGEGWLYLATIMDAYSRRIVGWSLEKRMTKELVIDALRKALIKRRPDAGLIHHSDRGSQYCSNDYRDLLNEQGIVCSMSKKGDCYDNAMMESFYKTLKAELVYLENFKTRNEARREIFDYIEVFYNRWRMHSSIDYQTPEEFEETFKKKMKLATKNQPRSTTEFLNPAA